MTSWRSRAATSIGRRLNNHSAIRRPRAVTTTASPGKSLPGEAALLSIQDCVRFYRPRFERHRSGEAGVATTCRTLFVSS